MIPARHPHVKWKKTGTTGILLNLITGDFYELDPSAIAIWKAIDGRSTVTAMAKKLATAYSASPAVVQKDVTRFVAELHKRKLISRG